MQFFSPASKGALLAGFISVFFPGGILAENGIKPERRLKILKILGVMEFSFRISLRKIFLLGSILKLHDSPKAGTGSRHPG